MPEREPWHALFAPLPEGAVPTRSPVGTPEILASPEGAAIAGWEQLSLNLSDPPRGLRHVLVVLDGTGRPISAHDGVLFHEERADGAAEIVQESLGGRIEIDGTFRGTRWISRAPEPTGDEEAEWDMTRGEPTAGDVASLLALVEEMLRRSPPRA